MIQMLLRKVVLQIKDDSTLTKPALQRAARHQFNIIVIIRL